MNWLKRIYWRRCLSQSQRDMQVAKEAYDEALQYDSIAEVTKAYHIYCQHRRASVHYAMKLARK